MTADIGYEPPGGDIGPLVAKVFGVEFDIQALLACHKGGRGSVPRVYGGMLENGRLAP